MYFTAWLLIKTKAAKSERERLTFWCVLQLRINTKTASLANAPRQNYFCK